MNCFGTAMIAGMVRRKAVLLVVGLGLAMVASASAFSVVVIDPGHGGSDPGTRWHGLVEKNLALDVAKRVDEILRGEGVPTVMTRRTDRTVSLDARAGMANRFANSLLVSIHFNANRIQGISGYETFYRSAKGKTIALTLQKAMGEKIKGRNRGVKNYDFAVLTRTKGPAVLIECAFISNRTEANRVQTAAHRQALALGIANGIIRSRKLW
ncbi:N-acetylmuramoyl-L-alanine amidase [Phragmitibacter flavus]|uniref:N-acetylmuramoyl-L-alanine amidase n=1 Tax=Phragmitibacter flavus TaxID=2576071 RepID=A0A5R8KGM4_9BACT|nr:N-acetylmuramoyl-L-alanine amidase [Phragmitibacter flavus]TLD71454.1 N-acetylmuramoyl-L-alanine amidase [Phragmitibacter flavus]